jgi:uncharacterized membrane protein YeaQ/YmgE (transglycosylase-associated protein family)
MGILAFLILGFFAGALAKALLPRRDEPGRLVTTALIGVAGALLGGFVASTVSDTDPLGASFDLTSGLVAMAGAVVVLLVYAAFAVRQDDEPSGARS